MTAPNGMTEAKWLASTDLDQMLGYLRGGISDRKLRLFGVACCLHGGRLGGDEPRRVVEMAEWYADGMIGAEELWRAYNLLPDGEGRRVAIPRPFEVEGARA